MITKSSDVMPLLYTFRRCPYAIRARMAIFAAGIKVELHEVALQNKPQALLDISSKGTVPVLCLEDKILDESLDIMRWALNLNDPQGWYKQLADTDLEITARLIEENDHDFKVWLDKYKYSDRFTEHSAEYYQQKCGKFLLKLETILQHKPFLLRSTITLADIAIFPFVRQFAMVDQGWFVQSPYPHTRTWLNTLLALPLFIRVMARLASQ